MGSIAQVLLVGVLLGCGGGGRTDEYSDETRPYEFGFLIDGEQHRYEKKDEKGIIMGEYGFITADGVYHVTVYATDETGNFRILKTRNIRIGLDLSKPPATTTTQRPGALNLNGLRGCGGCLIPDKSETPPSEGKPNLSKPADEIPMDVGGGSRTRETAGLRPKVGSTIPPSLNVPQKATNKQPRLPKGPSSGYKASINGVNKNLYVAPTLSSATKYKENDGIKEAPQPEHSVDLHTPGTTPKKMLTNTEMEIFDLMARLYKFNYTLSYHGHEEEGDTEGRKKGSYFDTGRDGNRRQVVYLANENGYQPVITVEKVDPLQTPHQLTEKQLTQLKGSQFIWFFNQIKQKGLK